MSGPAIKIEGGGKVTLNIRHTAFNGYERAVEADELEELNVENSTFTPPEPDKKD